MLIFAVDSFVKRNLGRSARFFIGGMYGGLVLFFAFSFFCVIVLVAMCKRFLECIGIIKDSLHRFKFM